ncbi:hypothetical protein FCOIX_11372 [Fusarium coicis]|nr:hypothetical protein FCOIX_11372 [Fusarium coicis]
MYRLASYSLFLVLCVVSLCILSATALPEGCGGSLGIVSITSAHIQGLRWTCSNIDPSSVPGSGDNLLLSHSTQSDVKKCGTYCGNHFLPGDVMAAFWYPYNSMCQCWNIGLFKGSFTAARHKTSNITLVDFYDRPPSPAVKFGVFTCPAGAYSAKMSTYGSCGPLIVTPASAPLVKGTSALLTCRSVKAEYAIQNSKGTFDCYKGLSKAKYQYHYSSKLTLYDLVDFPAPKSKK